MKNRNILGIAFFSRLWHMPIFIIFISVFMCGAIAGSVTGKISAITDEYIIKSFANMIVEQSTKAPTFIDALKEMLSVFMWQFAIVFSGILTPTSLFICFFIMIKGFLLAFSASSLFGALGFKGIIISLCSSGIASIITIPCLLITATTCYYAAKQSPKNKKYGYFYVLKNQKSAILTCTVISVWFSALKLPFAYAVCNFID